MSKVCRLIHLIGSNSIHQKEISAKPSPIILIKWGLWALYCTTTGSTWMPLLMVKLKNQLFISGYDLLDETGV